MMTKLHTGTILVLLTTLGALFAGPVVAEEKPSPEEEAHAFRTSVFTAMKWKMGKLAGAREEQEFQKHARDLTGLAGLITEGFELKNSMPEGSKAKPEIWSDWNTFSERAKRMQDAANGLGQPGAMAAFDPRDFGRKNCGGCHKDFKERD